MAETIQSGDIVELKIPSKPGTLSPQLEQNIGKGYDGYIESVQNWPGFTHGIVAAVEDEGRQLFVYRLALMYDTIEVSSDGLPVRAQYHVSEVRLVRKGDAWPSIFSR